MKVNPLRQPAPPRPRPSRTSAGSLATRLLWHAVLLVIAAGCFALYEHFKVVGRSDLSLGFLVTGAVFGFAPLRDVIGLVFGIGGGALRLVHLLGSLALVAAPLSGLVSGTPLLTHAAMAPFAIMGAAQAVMHQNQPRNARQAAAMQSFAASLPEVAQIAGGKSLASPANARRAVAVLSDIIAKAQALGETELQSDPRFQSAMSQVSGRFGAKLGLDAVDLVLARLAANPATASAVPQLRKRLASARETIAAAGSH
jgi:hypothetical protein